MEYMVDLETISTASNASIVSIGVVAFDSTLPDGKEIVATAKWNTIPDKAGEITYGTFMWWLDQSKEAQDSLKAPKPIPLITALENFRLFVTTNGLITKIWSHGSDFDLVILANAFKRLFPDDGPPWTYKEPKDTRTLFELMGISVEKTGIQHDALQDALNQTYAVIKAEKAFALMLAASAVANTPTTGN